MAIRMDDVGRESQRLDRLRAPRLALVARLCTALGTVSLILVAGLFGVEASSEGLDENQLKAAYLYNFARYVEWPSSAHESKGSSLEIGVVGGGPVSDLLKKTVVGKKVGDRQLRVVDVLSPKDARNSHILFIPGDSSAADQKQVVEDLKGTHVFVVGDSDNFAKRGGIANFIVSDSRVKFAINKTAATRAGLKVSSKLLRLAELVE